jgi:hypothetical protein
MEAGRIRKNSFLWHLYNLVVYSLPPNTFDVLNVRVYLFSSWKTSVHKHSPKVVSALLELWAVEDSCNFCLEPLEVMVDVWYSKISHTGMQTSYGSTNVQSWKKSP